MNGIKMGWDKLKRFLQQAHTWTGQQTFTNINVTGGSISGAVSTELYATSTDPAVNAAVTTAIVDGYNGVVITLTGAGNAQTLQSPTATTVKKFIVFNNDTSGANTIVVNGITLTAGKGQPFVWDGTAWGPTDIGITSIPVPVTEGGTGVATLTNHGVLLGSGTSALTPMAVGATGEVIIGQTGADPIWSSTATCNLNLPDAGKIALDIAPASDHTCTGIVFSATAGENLVYGDVCYIKSDGKYWKIDADAAATMPATAMATATILADAAGVFLDYGWARDDSWSWTIGGLVYASTDSGGLTQTAPSGDGDQIQIVGRAETATTIFFHPTEITTEIGLDYVDKGTADYTITMAELTAVPKTFAGNKTTDQTFTLAAPSAADAGKKFIQKKNGTGAGKLILQLPAGVTAYNAAGASSAAGTIYLAASARGTIQFTIESATSVSVDFADGTITTT